MSIGTADRQRGGDGDAKGSWARAALLCRYLPLLSKGLLQVFYLRLGAVDFGLQLLTRLWESRETGNTPHQTFSKRQELTRVHKVRKTSNTFNE